VAFKAPSTASLSALCGSRFLSFQGGNLRWRVCNVVRLDLATLARRRYDKAKPLETRKALDDSGTGQLCPSHDHFQANGYAPVRKPTASLDHRQINFDRIARDK
jgi:hypothetical protein